MMPECSYCTRQAIAYCYDCRTPLCEEHATVIETDDGFLPFCALCAPEVEKPARPLRSLRAHIEDFCAAREATHEANAEAFREWLREQGIEPEGLDIAGKDYRVMLSFETGYVETTMAGAAPAIFRAMRYTVGEVMMFDTTDFIEACAYAMGAL